MKRNFPVNPFADFHSKFPFIWDDEPLTSSGVTIYEDESHIIVEAPLPGVSGSDIEVTHNHGYLLIEGERKEEKKDEKRKYYRKANLSFSYRISLPHSTDESGDPKATFKDGIMTVTFPKLTKKKKKIFVKEE